MVSKPGRPSAIRVRQSRKDVLLARIEAANSEALLQIGAWIDEPSKQQLAEIEKAEQRRGDVVFRIIEWGR